MTRLRDLIQVLWQDFRAWRRGDRRVLPRFDVNGRVIQGRVYAKRGMVAGPMPARVRAVGRMSLRVFRAATDTWEDPVDVGPIYKEER